MMEIVKYTMETFMDSYKITVENVMMLSKIVERQQEEIRKLNERINMLEEDY